jgi:hypothetical protein
MEGTITPILDNSKAIKDLFIGKYNYSDMAEGIFRLLKLSAGTVHSCPKPGMTSILIPLFAGTVFDFDLTCCA